MKVDYNRYFERRREVCGGERVVQGTRVTERTLLALAARITGVFRNGVTENGVTESWASCLILLTDHKLRLHHPAR